MDNYDEHKAAILVALHTFMESGPRLEFANYGDIKAYRAESRQITRDLHDARILLQYVECHTISGDMLAEAFKHSFSGRLSWDWESRGIEYCTGQYYPTEYRRAVCAVLSGAI